MPKALLVMLDGVRPDALDAVRCPALAAFRQRGAFARQARSVMPSVTLPCHMSIFHSVPPTRHGVVTNDWMPMARPVSGLVEQAQRAGLRSAFFYNWEPLRNLSRPGSLEFSYFKKTAKQFPHGDDHSIEMAAQFIGAEAPDFVFLYCGTIDEMGHHSGWMSSDYLVQLQHVDGRLGPFLANLPDDYAVLIQSDHGGHGRTHGTAQDADMNILWMLAGPGVAQGVEISQPVTLLDTAPTLARVLGIDPGEDWEGRVVEEAFDASG